jgi:hypothetical protein
LTCLPAAFLGEGSGSIGAHEASSHISRPQVPPPKVGTVM